nr:pilin [Pseudomonas luteola]
MTEGLNLASAAKLAVADTLTSGQGEAIAAYAGTGAPDNGSYGYQFTATRDVASIAIAETAAVPVAGNAAITITYNATVNSVILTLIPGSGAVANGAPTGPIVAGQPIVWGCQVNSAANTQFVPANCRNVAGG